MKKENEKLVEIYEKICLTYKVNEEVKVDLDRYLIYIFIRMLLIWIDLLILWISLIVKNMTFYII